MPGVSERPSRHAGTAGAGAVAGGAVAHHQAKKNAERQEYEGAAYDDQVEAQVAPPAVNTAADIQSLAELHASGALTDEEFAAAKAKILGA